MGGLPLYERDAAALAKVAAQSVKAELMALGAMTGNGSGKVKLAFTGNISVAEIEKLLSNMDFGEGYQAEAVKSILADASAVSRVLAADYVVLVEEQEKSSYSQIEQELEQLGAWKKKVLGIVVVGVDAVP